MSTHYVAVVKVIKVEKELSDTTTFNQGSKRTQVEVSRRSTDMMSLSMKASTLDALIHKVQGHMEILDDDDEIADEPMHPTFATRGEARG